MELKKQKKKKNILVEYIEAIVIAFLFAIVIKTFIVAAYQIPSGSMLQTLQIGDYLLVNKFIYGVKNPFTDKYLIEGKDPERGDIIIFPYPQDPSIDYVKRIVGIPGDILEIKDKQLYRNGEKVVEDYIQYSRPNYIEGHANQMQAIQVPPGKYFVMGDNRDDSLDSRFWGFVDRENIRGKAWRFYFSWDKEADGLDKIRFERIGSLVHQ